MPAPPRRLCRAIVSEPTPRPGWPRGAEAGVVPAERRSRGGRAYRGATALKASVMVECSPSIRMAFPRAGRGWRTSARQLGHGKAAYPSRHIHRTYVRRRVGRLSAAGRDARVSTGPSTRRGRLRVAAGAATPASCDARKPDRSLESWSTQNLRPRRGARFTNPTSAARGEGRAVWAGGGRSSWY